MSVCCPQARASPGAHVPPFRGHSRTSSQSSLATAETTSSCESPMQTDCVPSMLGRLHAVMEMAADANVAMDAADPLGALSQLVRLPHIALLERRL